MNKMRLREKTTATLLIAIFMISMLTAFVSVQADLPPLPHGFYGDVMIGGVAAPDGTLVEAKIDGVTYLTTTTSEGKYGYDSNFHVPGDDLTTPEVVEGGVNGDTVDFYVGGVRTADCTFEGGQMTELDLSIPIEVWIDDGYIHGSCGGHIWNYDAFATIQEGIDGVPVGGTVHVAAGTYTENVDVNKSLTIRSENGPNYTIVQAANSFDHVFAVTANNVTINGFTIIGANVFPNAGIYLHAYNTKIENNNASYNFYGVYMLSSHNNVIAYNTVSSNKRNGINVRGSNNNMITYNNVSRTSGTGIYLGFSKNNILTGNMMSENLFNFGIYGHELSHYIQQIDSSNKVDGKSVYYLVNEENVQIQRDAGFVGIVNSSKITVKNVTLRNNREGVLLAYSDYCRIENVNASCNALGISLRSSNNNVLSNNTVLNGECGICLWSSINNIITDNNASYNALGIYLSTSRNNTLVNNIAVSHIAHGIHLDHSSDNNVYLNNFENGYSEGSINRWNSLEEVTYTYNGTVYTGYLGNYWSDYTGSDAYGDGIGDTPYSIDGDKDNYPLMEPFENYITDVSLVTLEILTPLDGSIIEGAFDITFKITNTGDKEVVFMKGDDCNRLVLSIDYSSVDVAIGWCIIPWTTASNGLALNPGETFTKTILYDPSEHSPPESFVGDAPYGDAIIRLIHMGYLGDISYDELGLVEVEVHLLAARASDLAVFISSFEYWKPGEPNLLNVTVLNQGVCPETGVEIQLFLNGSIVDSTLIPELVNGSSYTWNVYECISEEGTYNLTAYTPPVPGEINLSNNFATKLITVKRPLINPVPGQYVNYTFYSRNETVERAFGWAKITYQSYVTPILVNVSMEQQSEVYNESDWTLVNVMNRQGEYGNATWLWWIETDIKLDDEIRLGDMVAKVVDSGIIDAAGFTRECWILESVQPEWNGTWFGFDKDTGVLIYLKQFHELGELNWTLTSTNIFSSICTREIALFEGWNLIGLPCTPEDPSIEVVLSNIIDYVECVWAFDGETKTWSSYSPGAPSDLSEIVEDRGYWINMIENVTLTVRGESADTSELALFEGWNLIGLPLTPEDPSIEVVLTNIVDDVNSVWTFDGETKTWSSYSHGAPSNLSEMVDDRGYWINMTEDATLTVARVSDTPDYGDVPLGEIGGLHYVYWDFGRDTFQSLNITVRIYNEPSLQDGLYFQMYQGFINDVGFYFGIQTDVYRPGVGSTGKGLIFSRWGTRDLSNARPVDDGWTESAGYEGDFIGIRKNYEWTTHTYRLKIANVDSDDIGDWYSVWIEDLDDSTIDHLGSIRFPRVESENAGIKNHGITWTELYYKETQDTPIPSWHVSITDITVDEGRSPLHASSYYSSIQNTDIYYDKVVSEIHFLMGYDVEREHSAGLIY